MARRVLDRHVLHLLKMWLETPVEETDERGGTKRTTRNRDEKRGIPQGSPLPPPRHISTLPYPRSLRVGRERGVCGVARLGRGPSPARAHNIMVNN